MAEEAATETEEVATGEQAVPDPQREEVEAEARKMGWRPEEEWEGDKTNWRDAPAFIESKKRLAERADAVSKAEIRRLNSEIAAFKAENAEVKQMLFDMKDMLSKADQKGYERARQEIMAKQRKAVEDGDVAAFDAASKEMDTLSKDIEEAAGGKGKPDVDPDKAVMDPKAKAAQDEFFAENEWYYDDPDMGEWCDKYARRLAAKWQNERRSYDPDEFFAEIARATKAKFKKDDTASPGSAGKRQPAAVEGSGTAAARRPSAKTWANLPAEAKEAGKRFVKQGLFENEEEYAKQYFALSA